MNDPKGITLIPIAQFSDGTAAELVDRHLDVVDKAHGMKLPGAMSFEGGEVYGVDVPDGNGINTGVWLERTYSDESLSEPFCQVSHKHFGERVLTAVTAPNAVVIVMSYEPIVVQDELGVLSADQQIQIYEHDVVNEVDGETRPAYLRLCRRIQN